MRRWLEDFFSMLSLVIVVLMIVLVIYTVVGESNENREKNTKIEQECLSDPSSVAKYMSNGIYDGCLKFSPKLLKSLGKI